MELEPPITQMKRLQKDKISVGIIGLGNIGMSLENFDNPKSFKTHLKSFYISEKFEINFVLDSNLEKLKIAKKNYPKIKNFVSNIDELITYPKLIVLCASESSNLLYFNRLKDNIDINYFFVEKPFRLKNHLDYKNYKNKVIINYYRKFLPVYINLKNQISSKIYGELKSLTIRYSKGVYNSLTHFIDLLVFLFNDSLKFENCSPLDKISLTDKDDFSLSFVIKDFNKNGAHAYFNSINYNDLYVIDIEFYFEKVKLEVKNYESEIIFYKKTPDKNFNKYFDFRRIRSEKVCNIDYMKHVIRHLPKLLNDNISEDYSIVRDKYILEIIDKIKIKCYE